MGTGDGNPGPSAWVTGTFPTEQPPQPFWACYFSLTQSLPVHHWLTWNSLRRPNCPGMSCGCLFLCSKCLDYRCGNCAWLSLVTCLWHKGLNGSVYSWPWVIAQKDRKQQSRQKAPGVFGKSGQDTKCPFLEALPTTGLSPFAMSQSVLVSQGSPLERQCPGLWF